MFYMVLTITDDECALCESNFIYRIDVLRMKYVSLSLSILLCVTHNNPNFSQIKFFNLFCRIQKHIF